MPKGGFEALQKRLNGGRRVGRPGQDGRGAVSKWYQAGYGSWQYTVDLVIRGFCTGELAYLLTFTCHPRTNTHGTVVIYGHVQSSKKCEKPNVPIPT